MRIAPRGGRLPAHRRRRPAEGSRGSPPSEPYDPIRVTNRSGRHDVDSSCPPQDTREWSESVLRAKRAVNLRATTASKISSFTSRKPRVSDRVFLLTSAERPRPPHDVPAYANDRTPPPKTLDDIVAVEKGHPTRDFEARVVVLSGPDLQA